MSKRKRIPPDITTRVLVDSGRRCCLCFGLDGDLSQKRGQIAHLDRDPGNCDPDNLAFLCLDHHDQYDSTTSQSKGLTVREVKLYRDSLYEAVRNLRTSESEQGEAVPRKESDRVYLLPRIRTGKELVAVARDAHFFMYDNDELVTEEEKELVGKFLQYITDFCEDLGSRGPGTVVSTAFWFNSRIEELERSGFRVYGKREQRRMKVGDMLDVWDVAMVTVIRATNPSIIDMNAVRRALEETESGAA